MHRIARQALIGAQIPCAAASGEVSIPVSRVGPLHSVQGGLVRTRGWSRLMAMLLMTSHYTPIQEYRNEYFLY
jgi:hypothetical protein